jgi:D-glycero-D-manno-heptose 1,7-bisphosphate phosphatase
MGVHTLMRRAVFLDRDGVLNHTTVRDGVPYPPASEQEVELLDGVPEALALLVQHHLLLIVITNQPDVARGSQTRAMVERINQRLREQLPLDAIFTCYHDTIDGCDCRKPRPGLLIQAKDAYAIDLGQSFIVGDRWSDVAAGQAAGCHAFLLDVPYNQRQRCTPDYVVASLLEAARRIVELLDQEEEQRHDLSTRRTAREDFRGRRR